MTGGVAVGAGLLLIAIDIYAHHPGRGAAVALFAGLVLLGYVTVAFLPAPLHPAGVTAIVIGVFGALGWWWLPHAQRFADVRPFIILTILAYAACFVAPVARGRVIFVALILILGWLWIIGEIAGSDSYSVAPVPSPPAHTVFSLSALHRQTAGHVTLGDLNSDDPLYPIAEDCDAGNLNACDGLYRSAPDGSDFQTFGGQCGDTFSSATPGECALSSSSSGGLGNIDGGSRIPSPFTTSNSNDKSLQIGLVSSLFGLVYLFGLFILDRRGYRGLAVGFVIPCALALFTGTEALGQAADHPWVGGMLTVIAGLLFGLAGDRGDRRFTAWGGAVAAAIGSIVVAFDLINVTTTSTREFRLIKPGMIAIGTGVALVLVAWAIAHALARIDEPPVTPPDSAFPPPPPPAVPPEPEPVGAPPLVASAPVVESPPVAPPVAPPQATPGPPSWEPPPPTWPPPANP